MGWDGKGEKRKGRRMEGEGGREGAMFADGQQNTCCEVAKTLYRLFGASVVSSGSFPQLKKKKIFISRMESGGGERSDDTVNVGVEVCIV